MAKFGEKRLVAGSLIALGFIFIVIAINTDCMAGGADNYAHYNIARWAFRYPHLFLDHWGKPLFTVLIAPFTQFGFFGARLFNITAGLLTAWISYLIAVQWKMSKAWLVPVFVIFAPMYFIFMFTGMTEIFFSLVLILSILMFFKDRFIFSAIVISFIILVRSEGFIFLPLFFAGFLLKRKYTAIPFLLTGFLLFSLIGKFYYYHDFMWLITKLPYGADSGAIYGSGELLHFVLKMPDYLGYAILVLFLVGTFYWLKDWVSSKFRLNTLVFYQLLIPAACFFGFMAAHSYMWWRGEMSLGLVRVMAGVSPIAGILALAGFNKIESLIPSLKLKSVLVGIIILGVTIPGVLKYNAEFRGDKQSVVIKKAINWLHETKNFNHHLIVHDPSVAFLANLDAWNQEILQYGFSDSNNPGKALPDSSIFIWDAHFSQNEGGISASKILENPQFELIAYFEPKIPFQVLGDNNYCVMIFRKVNERTVDNYTTLNQLKENIGTGDLVYRESIDFETSVPEKVQDKFRVELNDSSKNTCYQLGSETEFSPAVLLTDHQLEISGKLSFVVTFDFLPEENLDKNEFLMVFSVEKENKSYNYQASDILPFSVNYDQWNKARFTFFMPEDLKSVSQVKIYLWDISKKKIKIDNLNVQAFSKKEE